MTSLWLDRPGLPASDPLPVGERLDDLVIGAGLTGLTTALLLARAGRRVAVIEARTVGAVTTGNTTAKLSLLQGTKLSSILRKQSHAVAQAYVDANLEGQQWLVRFCADHDVPVQTRDAITYAAEIHQVEEARNEHDAARSLGLDVRWHDQLDLPFTNHGGAVLADQYQFDPLDVLTALASQVREHGGTIHEGHRVVSASKTGLPTVHLDDGTELTASEVILATGTPILDRGLYFAKLEPLRSYALAFDFATTPMPMSLSAGQPSRSIRDVPRADGTTKLMIGGSGHTVGRTRSEASHVDELREWTARYFPGAAETHVWSAQDYQSHDGIPYVGALPRGGGRFHVATGFDKWGMTNAVAAARNLTASLLGEPVSWSKPMARRITRPQGAAKIAELNLSVGAYLAKGLVTAELKDVPDSPPEGAGVVGRDGLLPTGVSTVDGQTCAVRALCTHLGGVLKWNDQEKSWDCPLHGSRFTPDGEVLEGPATRPLRTS
ncbi:FAD-dependent oxidoreductase [Aeromicrobium ginsengisoli]|uniref:FAD-dependent oxidoreductase n=1 Tax=Aeromicrobium ginsengisoli TaxID=363867 RepID=A0A5M4FDX8_9ACTN|nr:FAD-dependent oxidoreductase [Aeromicrobium ginsengisoli]KAA1397410.1 FAD-dependent oxidoreductase [Aeromicrobium ginsengisoli]